MRHDTIDTKVGGLYRPESTIAGIYRILEDGKWHRVSELKKLEKDAKRNAHVESRLAELRREGRKGDPPFKIEFRNGSKTEVRMIKESGDAGRDGGERFAILPGNILSLADFKQRTPKSLAQMKGSGRPLVLTMNGRAELVLLPAGLYQHILEMIERAQAIEGIRRGLESFECGKGRPAVEALEELRQKHEIPR